jgi:hypothetical protein
VLEVSEVAAFETAFRIARDNRAKVMLVLPSPVLVAHRRSLIGLAVRYRLPAFYEFKPYVENGGLMSYGASIDDMFDAWGTSSAASSTERGLGTVGQASGRGWPSLNVVSGAVLLGFFSAPVASVTFLLNTNSLNQFTSNAVYARCHASFESP